MVASRTTEGSIRPLVVSRSAPPQNLPTTVYSTLNARPIRPAQEFLELAPSGWTVRAMPAGRSSSAGKVAIRAASEPAETLWWGA